MNIKVPVGVSNRHVHLTQKVYNQLFDHEPSKRFDLNQPGQFACNETLDIKTAKGIIKNVRIVGPFRDYNQVEISNSDAYYLGINPPVRSSGDLYKSENITLVTAKGEVSLESSCIIANRHIHISKSDALKYHLNNDELVDIEIPGEKGANLKAHIKITDQAFFEMHIDIDDANAFQLNNKDEVIIHL